MTTSDARQVEQGQQPSPKLQIYPSPSNEISSFMREKYERDAKKYWDVFYKHHQDKFFKDRHYLDKEWGQYFSEAGRATILEVGCGAGNTIFPLISTYPDIFVHACDFSPRAVNLVKTHKDFIDGRVNAFVCDLTADDLSQHISPSSVDIVSMIFVLSAVSPQKMALVLQNIRKVLKPNGCVLFRDYATGDLAQERFSSKDQKISENFYVRGDGTRAFYFSEEFLTSLFEENGFKTEAYGVCCKQVENRSREIVMNRRWVQAVFRVHNSDMSPSGKPVGISEDPDSDIEINMSEGVAGQMFGISNSDDECSQITEVKLKEKIFSIKLLSKEHQHTCKSTGLMLWESSHLMASILSVNPSIVANKNVLELGCGCGGICSMIAAEKANLMVATDGDEKALNLLTQNINLNLKSPYLQKLIVSRLEWGNKTHIGHVKKLSLYQGFDIIIGTDVTYVPEAILPLFETAKELLSGGDSGLILCHVFRRVDEVAILSVASRFSFRLVDRWPIGSQMGSSGNIISSWFSEGIDETLSTAALNIMYFERIE